ncbi:MAG: AbrB/MazE/SpoVT family DNA-binding domain-containing protein [Candidatus Methanomethylicia archaeon]
MEVYRVKVHRKGIIVIPAEVRRKLGIAEGSVVELFVDDEGGVRIKVPEDFRSLFGVDGLKALEVARLIVKSRVGEVEKEVHS